MFYPGDRVKANGQAYPWCKGKEGTVVDTTPSNMYPGEIIVYVDFGLARTTPLYDKKLTLIKEADGEE